jgi:hypothetical protein
LPVLKRLALIIEYRPIISIHDLQPGLTKLHNGETAFLYATPGDGSHHTEEVHVAVDQLACRGIVGGVRIAIVGGNSIGGRVFLRAPDNLKVGLACRKKDGLTTSEHQLITIGGRPRPVTLDQLLVFIYGILTVWSARGWLIGASGIFTTGDGEEYKRQK